MAASQGARLCGSVGYRRAFGAASGQALAPISAPAGAWKRAKAPGMPDVDRAPKGSEGPLLKKGYNGIRWVGSASNKRTVSESGRSSVAGPSEARVCVLRATWHNCMAHLWVHFRRPRSRCDEVVQGWPRPRG